MVMILLNSIWNELDVIHFFEIYSFIKMYNSPIYRHKFYIYVLNIVFFG